MSLVVTQRPSVTDTETSTWNAVGNPVLYKMQRKDFTFNQVNNNGGFVQLQFNGVDITGSFANGNSLYVKSDNDVYDSFGEQTAEAFSGGNTLITTDIPYVSAAPGGFCNNDTLRPLYRVEVEVYNADDELLNDAPFAYSPTSKGALTIDISAILRANLLPDINFDLTGTTEVFEDTDYIGFYIKYREVWTGSAESQTDDVANQFYSVFAANQIPAHYGGNMFVNVNSPIVLNDTTFLTSEWTNQGTGQDWSIVDGPSIGVNLSSNKTKRARRSLELSTGDTLIFTINMESTGNVQYFIYLSNGQSIAVGTLTGTNNFKRSIVLTSDITYFEIEADDTVTLTNPTTAVYDVIVSTGVRFLTNFTSLNMWRGYPFLVSAIINEDITNDVYLDVDPDSTTPADYAGKLIAFDLNQIITDQTVDQVTIQIVEDDTVDVALSESLTVHLLEPCDNPIMLIGRNKQGGILQWLFDYSQEYTFDYGNDIKAKRLVLRAPGVTINDWEALQDFITLGEVYQNNIVELTSTTNKTSTRVGQQVYVLEPDGTMTGVIVIPTRNSTETKLKQHFFEIEIEYPNVFAL